MYKSSQIKYINMNYRCEQTLRWFDIFLSYLWANLVSKSVSFAHFMRFYFLLLILLDKFISPFVELLSMVGYVGALLYTSWLIRYLLLFFLDLWCLLKYSSTNWSPIFFFLPFKLFFFFFCPIFWYLCTTHSLPPVVLPLPLSSYIHLSCFGFYILNVTTFFLASLASLLGKYSVSNAFRCLVSFWSLVSLLPCCWRHLSSPKENLLFG